MNLNVPIVHSHISSKDTGVNGIMDSGQLDGIVIFDTKGDGPRIFIHWTDDAIRRQLIYSLMTSEELERFTRK